MGVEDANREVDETNIYAFLQYLTAVRTASLRMQFDGIEYPVLRGDTSGNCPDPTTCLFLRVPFYSAYDLNNKFDVDFDFSSGNYGITSRAVVIGARSYGFLIIRKIAENVCRLIDNQVDDDQVVSVDESAHDDFQIDNLDFADLQKPIQCAYDSGDDQYHLLVQAFDSDTV
jgi:hypothetical protein